MSRSPKNSVYSTKNKNNIINNNIINQNKETKYSNNDQNDLDEMYIKFNKIINYLDDPAYIVFRGNVYEQFSSEKELENYKSIIKKPMYLNKIRKKIEKREYSNFDEFKNDLFLIPKNAKKYNIEKSIIYILAEKFEKFIYVAFSKNKVKFNFNNNFNYKNDNNNNNENEENINKKRKREIVNSVNSRKSTMTKKTTNSNYKNNDFESVYNDEEFEEDFDEDYVQKKQKNNFKVLLNKMYRLVKTKQDLINFIDFMIQEYYKKINNKIISDEECEIDQINEILRDFNEIKRFKNKIK